MQRQFKTRLYIGFALAILLSALSGITSYMILQKQEKQRVWVREARTILDTTRSIRSMLTEMATSRSEFRATNQRQYLQPYYNDVKRMGETMRELKTLVADDPEVESIEVLLEQQVQDIFAFWKKNEEDAGNGAVQDIARLTGDEKARLDHISTVISELQKDENKLLTKRREEYDQLIHYTTLSISIDSIISLAIILVLIYVINREFQSRRNAQEQLSASNEQLRKQTAELQQSEKELKATTEELGAINQQLEKFVYTVAHDIKSPLSGIVGALGIISGEDAVQENPRLVQFVNLSTDAAVHLTDMVNFLLEYSRVNLAKQVPEMVHTKELLEQLAILLFPPKNVHIYVADNMPAFSTRKLKLIQVFQNLISNAIKYNDKERGIIEVGYKDKGSMYEFFVKDNGQGIPASASEKVFSITRTAGNKATADSSTGFGLSIAKMIVEEQGGNIWFESAVGAGTTFYFEWKK